MNCFNQQHLFQWRFLCLKQVVCNGGINFRKLLKATGKGGLPSTSDISPEFPNGLTLLGTFVCMMLLIARKSDFKRNMHIFPVYDNKTYTVTKVLKSNTKFSLTDSYTKFGSKLASKILIVLMPSI